MINAPLEGMVGIMPKPKPYPELNIEDGFVFLKRGEPHKFCPVCKCFTVAWNNYYRDVAEHGSPDLRSRL